VTKHVVFPTLAALPGGLLLVKALRELIRSAVAIHARHELLLLPLLIAGFTLVGVAQRAGFVTSPQTSRIEPGRER